MIVSGMSGSGKSKALDFFEDNGYYCLDNLPTKLLADIVNMLDKLEDFPNKACITIDVRDINIAKDAGKALQDLKIPTYATCFNGNITALSNGKTIEFTIEKGDVW